MADIIVEDGTGLATANSFNTVAEVRAYATARGVVLPEDDDSVIAYMLEAMDYISLREIRMAGRRVSSLQALCFPRSGVMLYGFTIGSDIIPQQLKDAQAALVIAAFSGINLLPNIVPADLVIREKVGPIDTGYADPTIVGTTPTLSLAEGLLALFYRVSGLYALTSVRI